MTNKYNAHQVVFNSSLYGLRKICIITVYI